MRLMLHRIAVILCLLISLAWMSPPSRAAEVEQADRSLVEHSAEIFFGTIDIETAVFPVTTDAEPAMNTEYTVLISDVIKGNLRPQTMVVVRQDGGDADFADGDGPLAPGAEYLFFTYYDPALLRLLRLSIPAVGPIPLAAINEASSYLSNRTVRLTVTGSIGAPSIQVNASRLLTESAVRFFLNQAPVPIPSVPGAGIP